MKKFLSLFVAAIAGGFASLSIFNYVNPQQTAYYSGAGVQHAKPVNFAVTPPEVGIDFTTAAEQSVHGVVHVQSMYQQEMNNYFDFYDPFRDFFRGHGGQQPKYQPQVASGSGVIISDDGYIVTNNHVVEDAEQVEITLNDNKKYKAKVIGTDPTTDLALLKVDAQGLPFVTYGNSDDLKVGEWVLAVGNPFNLTSTVTAGIVSAKGRNINILQEQFAIESFIQTDAAVNPGNSGGALVNSRGELVGINTAIASQTGSYSGYSFAIPVNIARKVVDDLMEFGEVQRAFIGVSIRDIDAQLADEKNISVQKGVYVNGLTEGGAAAEAGIVEGDIITHIGDHASDNVPQLQEMVARYRPGDKIPVTVLRDGKEKVFNVVLRNKNGDTERIVKDLNANITVLGADFEPVSKEEMSKLKIDRGMKVTGMRGGKLRSAGIKEGFIITKIDGKPIKTKEDISMALENKKGGVLIEGIYPNGFKTYYGFGL
ncbi:MAG: hypothetical protein POELPBGB_02997 [Bacteroidia bacterium]|nr:hypothetical protein [Bacteroidia bacterium]